jgi:hypothetical protein
MERSSKDVHMFCFSSASQGVVHITRQDSAYACDAGINGITDEASGKDVRMMEPD